MPGFLRYLSFVDDVLCENNFIATLLLNFVAVGPKPISSEHRHPSADLHCFNSI